MIIFFSNIKTILILPKLIALIKYFLPFHFFEKLLVISGPNISIITKKRKYFHN